MRKPSDAIISLLNSMADCRDALRRNGDTWFVEGVGRVRAITAESALKNGLVEKTKGWPGVCRFGCYSISQAGRTALAEQEKGDA